MCSSDLLDGLRGGTGADVYCTSLMSQAETAYYFPSSISIIEDIQKRGGRVFFSVDATRLERTLRTAAEFVTPSETDPNTIPAEKANKDDAPPLFFEKGTGSPNPLVAVENRVATISPAALKQYDFVVFAFPHCGQQHVTKNQALLKNFFTHAFYMLAKNTMPGEPRVQDWTMVDANGRTGELGQVHVILKESEPYTWWEMTEQAKGAGFRFLYKKPFLLTDFPGYTHQRTTQDHVPFDPSQGCYRYIYSLDSHVTRSKAAQARQKRKKANFFRSYTTLRTISRAFSVLRLIR